MTKNSNKPGLPDEVSPWFKVRRFLILFVFGIALFLSVQSMVHHRFFQGGWIDPNGTLRP
jgi:hypothetical protein